ncbi:MAG: aminomethyl-transferring glycine dehydrogenase subunit GcvPA [candidate division Zixibacteria bacterium]|nr:aminomethyl-transferring glycine dehydrogenase subunit GcvPA [candidate division Zixibacteria bacterium]
MSYIPNTEGDLKIMLKKLGVDDFNELIGAIPESLRLKGKLKLPERLSELELKNLLSGLAKENKNTDSIISFLGGGAYDHFIPSVINHILLRSEFYTAYTPYQPEVSQGTLQSIYEYQSMICQLTGMEVSNASMYDGASAVAEAALLSIAETGRKEILVSAGLNPNYLKVLNTYCERGGIKIRKIDLEDGITDYKLLGEKISAKTAGVILQSPNFFGLIENGEEIVGKTHPAGALLIMVCDPISLAILKTPGEYGADIAVGEGQALGNNLNFGGPFLGYFACRKSLVRRMPGRIVGATVDSNGKRGFVLVLQTREQHIRREKATSNICTNEALCALAAAIYLSLLGKNGLKKVAELCLQKSHYAAQQISRIDGFKIKFKKPFFKEFVIEAPLPAKRIIKLLLKKNIFAGIDLSTFDRKLRNCLMISVTEKRSKEEIDYLVDCLKRLIE